MRAIVVFLLALCLTWPAQAQTADLVDEVVADIAEELEADGRLSDDAADDLANLRSLADEPLDLNTATEDEMSQLIFLNPRQINQLLWHRRTVGGFETPQELCSLSSFSALDIVRLLTFAKVGDVPTREFRKSFRANIVERWQRSWPTNKGLREGRYQGGPVRWLSRAQVQVGDHWKGGFVLENDAGEPMFSHGTALTDFVSAYADYSAPHSTLARLVVGNYGLRLGQGLGVWTGFAFDPSVANVTRDRMGNGLRATPSASESGFLRGAAAEFRWWPVSLTSYVSIVGTDVTADTLADGRVVFSTMRSDGLHRTETERRYRHNNPLMVAGAYVRLAPRSTHVGVGVNCAHSRLPMENEGTPYRLFWPSGSNFITAHADYRQFVSHVSLYGEVACQGARAWGFTQGIDVDLRDGNRLSLSARLFSDRYFALLQQPVCQSSWAGGERGFTLDLLVHPWQRLALRGNVDVFRHTWLRSGVWAPTSGVVARLHGEWPLSKLSSISLRMRRTFREQGAKRGDKVTSLSRLLVTEGISSRFGMHSVVQLSSASRWHAEHYGWLVGQDVSLSSSSGAVSGTLSLSLFDTDNYDTRVYARQPNVLYDMSFAAYFGRGVALATMLRWAPLEHWKVWLWCNWAHYADRSVVGSGQDQTEGRGRTTVKLQVQWKPFIVERRRVVVPEL